MVAAMAEAMIMAHESAPWSATSGAHGGISGELRLTHTRAHAKGSEERIERPRPAELSVCSDANSLRQQMLLGGPLRVSAHASASLEKALGKFRHILNRWRRPTEVHAHELLVPVNAAELDPGATITAHYVNLLRALATGATPVHAPLSLWTNRSACPAMDMSCWFSSLPSLSHLVAACPRAPCTHSAAWQRMRAEIDRPSRELARNVERRRFATWGGYIDAKNAARTNLGVPPRAALRECRKQSLRCPQFVNATMPGRAEKVQDLAMAHRAFRGCAQPGAGRGRSQCARIPNLGSAYRAFAELLDFQLTPNNRLSSRIAQLRSQLGLAGTTRVLGVHAPIGVEACKSHGECRSFSSLTAPINRMIDAYGFTTAYLVSGDAGVIHAARRHFPALHWIEGPNAPPAALPHALEDALAMGMVDSMAVLDKYVIDISLLASTHAFVGSLASSIGALAYGLMTARASAGCFPPYVSIDVPPVCCADDVKVLMADECCPMPAVWRWGALMNAFRHLAASSEPRRLPDHADSVEVTLRCPRYHAAEVVREQLLVPRDAPLLQVGAERLWAWCCEQTNTSRGIAFVAGPTDATASAAGGALHFARKLWHRSGGPRARDAKPHGAEVRQPKDSLCICVRGPLFRSSTRRGEGRWGGDCVGCVISDNDAEQYEAFSSLQKYVIRPLKALFDAVVVCDVYAHSTNLSAANRSMQLLNPQTVNVRLIQAHYSNARAQRVGNVDAAVPPRTQLIGWRETIMLARRAHTCKHVLIVRADLLFKRSFPWADLLANVNDIVMPWQLGAPPSYGSVLMSGRMRVADTLAFVRRPVVFIDALNRWIRTEPNKNGLHHVCDMVSCAVMLPDYFREADSAKNRNDYYRIIGRPEAAPLTQLRGLRQSVVMRRSVRGATLSACWSRFARVERYPRCESNASTRLVGELLTRDVIVSTSRPLSLGAPNVGDCIEAAQWRVGVQCATVLTTPSSPYPEDDRE